VAGSLSPRSNKWAGSVRFCGQMVCNPSQDVVRRRVTLGCMGQKSVRFPDELQAAAEKWALANDRPFSYVVVKALEEFLARRSDPEMVEVPHRPPAAAPDHAQKVREMEAVKEHAARVKAAPVGRCPKATCSAAGPVGDRCPLHPNLTFKVL
jgi:hypothetical protein